MKSKFLSARVMKNVRAKEWQDFLHQATERLLACSDKSGALIDPVSGKETPSDHYALCFTALAAHNTGIAETRWLPLLKRWVSLAAEARGHLPFNRLALLLLQRSQPLSDEAAGWVTQALQLATLQDHYPSNNWTFLAQTCRVVETQGSAEKQQLLNMLQPWTTADGGFIDFPADPKSNEGSTPITYHAKFLSLLCIADTFCQEPSAKNVIANGLRWLSAWQDGDLLGGFGRSTFALFGDAGWVLANGFAQKHGMAAATVDWAQYLCRLQASTEQQLGLLPIAPAPFQNDAAGWDPYMFLTVYNAYFVGILAWTRAVEMLPSYDSAASEKPATVEFYDQEAGLHSARSNVATILASVRGQPIQTLERAKIDGRYAGGQLCYLRLHSDRVLPPPTLLSQAKLEQNPALAGWLPVARYKHDIYSLQTVSSHHIELTDSSYVALFSGRLQRVGFPFVRRFNRVWWESIFDLVAGKPVFYSRRPLQKAQLNTFISRCWYVDFGSGNISVLTILHRAQEQGIEYLNPYGAAWCRDSHIGQSFYDGNHHTHRHEYNNALTSAECVSDEVMQWPQETTSHSLNTGSAQMCFNREAMCVSTPDGKIPLYINSD